MLHDIVKKGSIDRSVTVKVVDSTDGTPETSVAFNTSGIDLWYRREGAAKTSITEATLAALTTAHADGGFLHIADGVCRLDLPDAAFATGANHVDFGGTITGMIVIGGRVRLVNYDPEDTVRLGLTALPNAVADAAGGLIISDAGGLDADAQIVTKITAINSAVAALNNLSSAQLATALATALTTAVADSIPADGARPSISQAAYLVTQWLLERAVVGTTQTIYKPDGTPLLTQTTDSPTAPTTITRAT